jgi:hypothetical protein
MPLQSGEHLAASDTISDRHFLSTVHLFQKYGIKEE